MYDRPGVQVIPVMRTGTELGESLNQMAIAIIVIVTVRMRAS